MSREAVAHYWSTYPQMLLSVAGKEAGRTWQRIEIDSYEAGGQDWSPVLPDEFLRRRGYDLRKWLPTYAGYTVGSEAKTKQFRKDLEATVTDLFAENYYGYMAELAHKAGMTFGKWGTQFTPGLTWWNDGAKALFGYMARCQSLLQQGVYVDDYRSRTRSLSAKQPTTQWLHRKADGADIYFVANTLDSASMDTLTIASTARQPEVWHPESGKAADAICWDYADGHVRIALKMQPRESAFVILRHPAEGSGTGLELPQENVKGELALNNNWTLRFPEGMDCPESVALDSLTPWNEHADEGIRHFSGTATYSKHIHLKRLDPKVRYVIDLGEVKHTAKLRVNGKEVAYLWNAPYRADITDALRRGDNLVGEIGVGGEIKRLETSWFSAQKRIFAEI